MRTLEPTDEKYGKAVKVPNPKECEVDCKELDADEGVVCPHDKDLKIGKNKTGEFVISKKSFTKPFR